MSSVTELSSALEFEVVVAVVAVVVSYRTASSALLYLLWNKRRSSAEQFLTRLAQVSSSFVLRPTELLALASHFPSQVSVLPTVPSLWVSSWP